MDISDFVLEGGSIEMDGNGTLIASLSSVVSRNQNLTVKQVEKYLFQYLSVTSH
ncbi:MULTISPECIES: agmatine deiminase family protein [unclassified Clostridioides]|uniref:agmatine deiminase family protein n=1 Tax=unclassified Clostridioides TaxID=2635829 RepID=UPI001D108292